MVVMHDVENADIERSLLARLDALASRVEEQALVIAEQSARISEQQDRITQLEGAAPGSGHDGLAVTSSAEATRDRSRRGFVKRLLGVAAAATVLTVAKEPPAAYAYVRGTIMGGGGSTENYGFIGTRGSIDPLASLPALGANSFGLIGTSSETSPAPNFSAAVAGFANTHGGVMGLSSSNVGTYGQSASHVGVYGVSQSNVGTYGQSDSNVGVYGSSGLTGVVGAGATGAGVQGASNQGPGVQGESGSTFGVYGNSPNTGVYGTSPNIGVWAISSTGTALFAQVTTGGGFAGHFSGNVFVNGALTVAGPFSRATAAIPHPDGSYRRMYSQEAAEPYFEDFGRGMLVNGQATVNLDPDVLALAAATDYLVFLTEIGDAGGLFVASQTPTSFTVQARVSSPRETGFTYRLIFRRGDLAARRMERVQVPDRPDPQPRPRSIDLSTRPHPVLVHGPDVAR